MRRFAWLFGLILAAGCGAGGQPGAPSPASPMDGTPEAARCAALLPPALPPPVTYACDGAGLPSGATTDGEGTHVALRTAVASADGATITYRFVPIGGGPPEPDRLSGRWGTLLDRPRGYYWQTQPRSLQGSPVHQVASDGRDLGPIPGLGPTLFTLTRPDGGLVASTVQGFEGGAPVLRQELVSGAGDWLGAVDPAIGWIDAVNARGHLLLVRDRAATVPSYRWADADLQPLGGWFGAYPRAHSGLGWFPLADGTLVALHGVGTYAFRDGTEGIWPAPAWLAWPARESLGVLRRRIRGGAGFAFDPSAGGCELEIRTADGVSCGRLKLPLSRCDAFVGADGTVIAMEPPPDTPPGAAAGCGWRWWPGLLR